MESQRLTKVILKQEEAVYKLPLEILLHTNSKDYVFKEWIEAEEKEFQFATKEIPLFIQLDPASKVLLQYDYTPVFETILTSSGKNLIIYGTGCNESESYKKDAEAAQKGYEDAIKKYGMTNMSYMVKSDKEVTEDELREANLFLLGSPECNRVVDRIKEKIKVRFEKDGFLVEGKMYAQNSVDVMFADVNPFNPKHGMFVKTGTMVSVLDAATGKMIGFDNYSSYVIFKGNKITIQGNFKDNRLVYDLKQEM